MENKTYIHHPQVTISTGDSWFLALVHASICQACALRLFHRFSSSSSQEGGFFASFATAPTQSYLMNTKQHFIRLLGWAIYTCCIGHRPFCRFDHKGNQWLWWGKRFLSPINSISYFNTFGEKLFEMADVDLQDHFSGLRVNQLDCDRWGGAVNFTRLWPQRQQFGIYPISSGSCWGDVLCTSLSLRAD